MNNEPAAAYDVPLPAYGPVKTPAIGRLEERRRVGRPQNGDTKPCPKCAAFICDFNERYRVPGAGVVPAWICDSPRCRYREMVRDADRTAATRELLHGTWGVQAGAKRLMLKARFVVQRLARAAGTGREHEDARR